MTRQISRCRRQVLSDEAVGSKIASTLSVPIAVRVASVFTMVKNSHEIIAAPKIFSYMFFRNFGIFATMKNTPRTVSRKRTQLMLKYCWWYPLQL